MKKSTNRQIIILFFALAIVQFNVLFTEQSDSVLGNFTSQKFGFSLDDSVTKTPNKKSTITKPLSKQERKALKANRKKLRNELHQTTGGKDRKQLSLEQLQKATILAYQLEMIPECLLYIDQILILAKDSTTIQKFKRMKADILFDQGSIEKAETLYKEYYETYPGAQDAEEILYKIITCFWLQTRDPDQDQTKTKNVIHYSSLYKQKAFSKHKQDVETITSLAFKLLYESEGVVFDYYLKDKNFGAAQGRLAYMKQEYSNKIASIEPDLLKKEYRLAQAQGDITRKDQVLALLEKKHPQHAAALVPSKNHKKVALNYVEKF